jgi:hypothetical protein
LVCRANLSAITALAKAEARQRDGWSFQPSAFARLFIQPSAFLTPSMSQPFEAEARQPSAV